MLKIHNPYTPGDVIPLPIDDEKRFVTHKANGFDTLTFELESDNPLYFYIVEEVAIEDETNRYVVKGIDEHSNFVTITCEIDLDEWKQTIYYEYRVTDALLADVIAEIIPAGWTVFGDGQITQKATVEESRGKPLQAVTPAEILSKAGEAYSCAFKFDVINRKVECIDPASFTPSGQFFTDELNLSNFGFVGSSQGFATRLYPFGAKQEDGTPTTIESVNGGLPYIEDDSYSDKVICVGWCDERYSVPENLLAAAKLRLEEISYPVRSYTCDAKNLNDDVYLFKVVTLIDRRRKKRVNHQIIEHKEYPNHVLDTITLSKTTPDIESFLNRVETEAQDKIDKETSTIQAILKETIDQATSAITGNKGGNFIWIFDSENRPVELVNLADSQDINTAQSVWRWNASGLGHSNDGYNGAMTMALLADGSINASAITAGTMTANLIRAGILQSADGTFKLDLDTGEVVIGGFATAQDFENLENSIDQQSQALEAVKGDLITIQTQTGDLVIQVQGLIENGVDSVTTKTGYTFKEDGLRISKSGEEMENKLDHTGMYVTRSDEVILQANHMGVIATDVTIRNYLNVGDFTRFENFDDGTDGNRTAMFYIG